MSFNEQFDQHGAWRREFALRLKLLAEWMKDHDLLDAAVEERLHRLEAQVRADKVMVAFVAEFSRGKSELINAIFFAGYGRRIMPASAGRTTMCPTELLYDPAKPTAIMMLPIDTRSSVATTTEYKRYPDDWHTGPFNVDNNESIIAAFKEVSSTKRVTAEKAEQLSDYNTNTQDDARS